MKYIFILLLTVLGCSLDPGDMESDIEYRIQQHKPKALFYKDKCFQHWAGHVIVWKDPKYGHFNETFNDGLTMCSIENLCDTKNPKKCINHLQCNAWSSYLYVEDKMKNMNLKGEVKCPGSE